MHYTRNVYASQKSIRQSSQGRLVSNSQEELGKRDFRSFYYFVLPIRQEDRKWLSFQWEKETYEFTCHPFGLSFQSVHQNSQAWMRQFGCRMITYIDDNFLLAPSKEEAQVLARLMVVLIEALEFDVNYKKSLLDPKQSMEFLGLWIDSRSIPDQWPLPSQRRNWAEFAIRQGACWPKHPYQERS